jgi:hypothetical protein
MSAISLALESGAMMSKTRRRWIAGIVLIIWAILGPIGMAFSACAVMGGCEGACTLTFCVPPNLSQAALYPIESVPMPFLQHPLMTVLKVPEPPPRSLPTSA